MVAADDGVGGAAVSAFRSGNHDAPAAPAARLHGAECRAGLVVDAVGVAVPIVLCAAPALAGRWAGSRRRSCTAIGMDLQSWSTALFSALPSVLAGLVLAGIAAALLSLGQAALFAAASSLSRNAWQAVTVRRGREGRRIFAARLVVLAVAAGGAAAAVQWRSEAPAMLDWAFAVAVAGESRSARCRPLLEKMQSGGRVLGHDRRRRGDRPDVLRRARPATGLGARCVPFRRPSPPLIGLAASAIVTVGASLIESVPSEGRAAALERGRTITVRPTSEPVSRSRPRNPAASLRPYRRSASSPDRPARRPGPSLRHRRAECCFPPATRSGFPALRCVSQAPGRSGRRRLVVLGDRRAGVSAVRSRAKRHRAGYGVEAQGSGFDRSESEAVPLDRILR